VISVTRIAHVCYFFFFATFFFAAFFGAFFATFFFAAFFAILRYLLMAVLKTYASSINAAKDKLENASYTIQELNNFSRIVYRPKIFCFFIKIFSLSSLSTIALRPTTAPARCCRRFTGVTVTVPVGNATPKNAKFGHYRPFWRGIK